MPASQENYRYGLTGKWGVTLEGVDVLRCATCGEHDVMIETPEALEKVVAAAVVRKAARLAPEEFVFLRNHLEMTGRDLGGILGVTSGTVSRWENGHEPINPTADRLVRTIVLLKDGDAAAFDIETLARIADSHEPLRLTVRREGGVWKTTGGS